MSDSNSSSDEANLARRQFQQGKYTYRAAAELCLAAIVQHATALQRALDNEDESLSSIDPFRIDQLNELISQSNFLVSILSKAHKHQPSHSIPLTPLNTSASHLPTTTEIATAEFPLIPISPLTRHLLEARTALSTTLAKLSSLSSRASGTTHRRLLEDKSIFTSRISILEARIEKAEGLAWGKVDTEGLVLGMLRIWEKTGDEERKRDWVRYVRGWVPHAILLAANASREEGVQAIEEVIQVAELLVGQGEQSLANAVLDALQNEVVKPIEPVWKALPKKFLKRLDDLKKGKGKTPTSPNLDAGCRRTQEDEEVEHWLLTRAYIPEHSPALMSEDTTQIEALESVPMTPMLGSDEIAQTATDDALNRLEAIVAKLRTPSRLFVDREQEQEPEHEHEPEMEMETYAFPTAPTTAPRIAMEGAQASFDSNAGLFEQSPERWLGEENVDWGSGSGSDGEGAEVVERLVREAEAEAGNEEEAQIQGSDSDDEDGNEEMKKFKEETKRRIAKAVKDMRKQNADEDASGGAARELIPEDVREEKDDNEEQSIPVSEAAVDDVIGRAMQELHMEDHTDISSVIGGTIPRVLSMSDLPAAGGNDFESESPPALTQNNTSLEGVKDGILIASESRAVMGQGESSLTKVENRRVGNVTITMGEDTKGKADSGSSVRVREDNDEREIYEREREAAAKVGVREQGKARDEESHDQPGKAEEELSPEGLEDPETRRPLTMENLAVESRVSDEIVSDGMAQESDTADPALSSGDGDEALKEAPSLVKTEDNKRRGKGKRGKGNKRGR
ncbi:hypothetical protein YB2330_004015 [Saitoella coloradoensis]